MGWDPDPAKMIRIRPKVVMVDQFLLSAGLFSSSSDLAPILATVCRL